MLAQVQQVELVHLPQEMVYGGGGANPHQVVQLVVVVEVVQIQLWVEDQDPVALVQVAALEEQVLAVPQVVQAQVAQQVVEVLVVQQEADQVQVQVLIMEVLAQVQVQAQVLLTMAVHHLHLQEMLQQHQEVVVELPQSLILLVVVLLLKDKVLAKEMQLEIMLLPRHLEVDRQLYQMEMESL